MGMYTLDKTLIEKFRKQIQDEIDELRYALSQGQVEDILTYKAVCAKIEGINAALSVFNELVKRLGEDKDD